MDIPTSVTIDWFSYTLDGGKEPKGAYSSGVFRAITASRASGHHGEWKEREPLHGYRYGVAASDKPSLMVLMDGSAPGMGIHVSWSGSALAGEKLNDRLKYALYAGGRCTRIDLAIDVPRTMDFRALFDAVRRGELDTRAKKCSIIDSDTGTTVYVGARTSEQYLRVYDKRGQTGGDQDWTRIELECKGRTANGIAQYLANGSLLDIPRIVRAFCDWRGNEQWEAIFSGSPKISVPKAEKITDRARWFEDGVKPAIRSGIEQDDKATKSFVRWCAERLSDKELWEILELRDAHRRDLPF
jgi:hypothetical protein